MQDNLRASLKMIQYTTRELDAGIFQDDHLEKRIKAALKKENVKLLSVVFYMTQQGKYEVHLTVKAMKGRVVLAKDVAFLVGKCIGRTMIPRQGERLVIGEEYGTIACMEGAKFQTLQGVARIGKGLEEISGDTFLMKDLPGGRKGVALSDGMGSGEEAFRDSTMVVEMLEELLEAGFPVETAVQMMNTALVTGREEVKFCTLDVCLFDLYQGSCEFVKAGASATFIKRKKEVEKNYLEGLFRGYYHFDFMIVYLIYNRLEMSKEELINQIIAIIGSDDNFDNQISDYEHVSMSRPEDLIQDRTSFEQMVLYANEMMYKIENVRNLVLNEID